jgi:hypothetical protein
MELTYQQILAEQYDENAKTLLVQPNESTEEEYVDDYNYQEYEENDLPKKEEFNKFHGDRNKPEHVIKPTSYIESKHREQVRLLNQVINIDGKFRGGIVPTNPNTCGGIPAENANPGTSSSYFVYYPSTMYKNVKSIKLTSFEFANTFYTFSKARGNLYMAVQPTPPLLGLVNIRLPEGNYTITDLVIAIQTQLTSSGYTITYDSVAHKFTISSSSYFQLNFNGTPDAPTNTSTSPHGNGLGYNLGFLQMSYTSPSFNSTTNKYYYTAECVPDVIQDTYIYLAINDYNLIEHAMYGQTFFSVFAKITLPTAKNNTVFDNNYTNSSSKIYQFQQPTNVNRLEIKLLDAFGNVLDLNGSNFSMTLELQEILDSSIYEKMLEL